MRGGRAGTGTTAAGIPGARKFPLLGDAQADVLQEGRGQNGNEGGKRRYFWKELLFLPPQTSRIFGNHSSRLVHRQQDRERGTAEWREELKAAAEDEAGSARGHTQDGRGAKSRLRVSPASARAAALSSPGLLPPLSSPLGGRCQR